MWSCQFFLMLVPLPGYTNARVRFFLFNNLHIIQQFLHSFSMFYEFNNLYVIQHFLHSFSMFDEFHLRSALFISPHTPLVLFIFQPFILARLFWPNYVYIQFQSTRRYCLFPLFDWKNWLAKMSFELWISLSPSEPTLC